MSGTVTYNRPKSAVVNSTGIVVVVKADEGPAPSPADLGGSDGILHAEFEGDADESGGTNVEKLFKTQVQVIASQDGSSVQLKITTTPVKGNGDDGTPVIHYVAHPETLDAWQTAVGRARQP